MSITDFTGIAQKAATRRRDILLPTTTTGIETVVYDGVEVFHSLSDLCVIETVRKPRFVYYNGNVTEGGIVLNIGTLEEGESRNLVRILRSAGVREVELLKHWLHPNIAIPNYQPNHWHKWRLGADLEQEAAIKSDEQTPLLKRAVDHTKPNSEVLFLGCNYGFEVLTFLKLMAENKGYIPAKITAVDYSPECIEGARALLHSDAIPSQIKQKINLRYIDARELTSAITPGSVDVVIGFAFFDTQTLVWEDGVKIAQQVHAVMNSQGYGFFKAYGPELFTAEHYHELGFEVKQKVDPSQLFRQGRPSQYVVRRNGHPCNTAITHYRGDETRQWQQNPQLVASVREQSLAYFNIVKHRIR